MSEPATWVDLNGWCDGSSYDPELLGQVYIGSGDVYIAGPDCYSWLEEGELPGLRKLLMERGLQDYSDVSDISVLISNTDDRNRFNRRMIIEYKVREQTVVPREPVDPTLYKELTGYGKF